MFARDWGEVRRLSLDSRVQVPKGETRTSTNWHKRSRNEVLMISGGRVCFTASARPYNYQSQTY